MVASLVQSASNATTGTAVASLAVGSTQGWVAPTVGNLIVAWVNADVTATTPTGFSGGPSVVDGNGVYLWYKIAAGTETTVTFPFTASDLGTGGLLEYSGVAASPFDIQNFSSVSGSSGTTTTAVSLTGTGATGDLWVSVAGLHGNSSGAGPASPTWTNSFTNRQTVKTGGVAAGDCYTFVADFQNTAAATVSTSASWTTAALDRQELFIAFKLGAGGAPAAPPPGILFIGPTRG